MVKTRKKQITTIILSSILLLAFLALSYFLITSSNANRETVITGTGTMSITYIDCANAKQSDCANINKNLTPGESVTKTFRVENAGTVNSGFEIIFKSLTNTFVDNELVYEVLDENDEVLITERSVPYGTSEGLTIFSDNVQKNETKTYKFKVTFKKLDNDQEANKTATYNIELGIKSSLTVVAQSTFTKLQSLNDDIKISSVTPNFANISPLPSRYQDDGITGSETSYTPVNNEYYLTYGDSYTFNEITGRYTLTNPQTCKIKDCYEDLVGKYYCYNTVYNNTTLHYNSNQSLLYQITSNTTDSKIYYKAASRTVLEYDNKDSGLFEAEDDYGQSLYFRGNVTNNYVKFGKSKNNQDMYWRIIRINGDGTLRLIYDGTSTHENGESSTDRIVGTSSFNTGSGRPYDAGYVGFMYGNFGAPTGCSCTSRDSAGNCFYTCTGGGSTSYDEAHENVNSSTIKTYLENWYTENIVNTGYSEAIADEIFCNDRTINRNLRPSDLGYGQNYTLFAAYSRLYTERDPILLCSRKDDSFTVSDTVKGNAKLSRPVGLITADELAYGGNVYAGDYNYKSYLYKGSWYWSLSPIGLNSFGNALVMNLRPSYIRNYSATSSGGVVPVINLKAETVQNFTGSGTMQDPFKIE